jgi:prevent-host-death family protein
MKQIKSSDAKARFSELLDEVEHGETISITRHGKVIAHILSDAAYREARQEDRAAQGRRAMLKLMELRKSAGRATIEEILAWRDEGRRF